MVPSDPEIIPEKKKTEIDSFRKSSDEVHGVRKRDLEDTMENCLCASSITQTKQTFKGKSVNNHKLKQAALRQVPESEKQVEFLNL